MPIVAPPSLQLDLFLRDTAAYQQALARYDRLRPILQGQATLTQQSRATGIPYNQLWRCAGYLSEPRQDLPAGQAGVAVSREAWGQAVSGAHGQRS